MRPIVGSARLGTGFLLTGYGYLENSFSLAFGNKRVSLEQVKIVVIWGRLKAVCREDPQPDLSFSYPRVRLFSDQTAYVLLAVAGNFVPHGRVVSQRPGRRSTAVVPTCLRLLHIAVRECIRYRTELQIDYIYNNENKHLSRVFFSSAQTSPSRPFFRVYPVRRGSLRQTRGHVRPEARGSLLHEKKKQNSTRSATVLANACAIFRYRY